MKVLTEILNFETLTYVFLNKITKMAIRTRTRRAVKNTPVVNRPTPTNRFSAFSSRFKFLNELPPTVLLVRAGWVCFLIVLCIFIRNNFDKVTYQTARAKSVMNEKRAIYISKKEAYSLESKQSELSKRLSYRGLDKSITPPVKIEELTD